MIPGYSIERVLGTGAHGKVYLAREEGGLERPVALKVFERKDDFERELAMVKKIEELRRRGRIAEIVQALGSGEHEGLSYIVLEYLESGSLADLVARDGPLTVERACAFTKEAARALAALHREGIFHRDVKPQNLLLGEDGRVRLGDFGLSRSLEGTLSAAGSPAFAAPEVIAGRVSDGRKVDVYSLGATLGFLLTGETILPGRPDVFALERRSVPRPLQQAIARACAADPAERTASVEELVAALDAKIPEIPRMKSGPPDGSAGGLNVNDTKIEAEATTPRRSKLAVASFAGALAVWFGWAWFFVFSKSPLVWVFMWLPLPGVLLAGIGGPIAWARCSRSQGRLSGRGLAIFATIAACLDLLVPITAGVLLWRDEQGGADKAAIHAEDRGWSTFVVKNGEDIVAAERWSWVDSAEPGRVRLEVAEATIRGDVKTRGFTVDGRHPFLAVAELVAGRATAATLPSSGVETTRSIEERSLAGEEVELDAGETRATLLVTRERVGAGIMGLDIARGGVTTTRELMGFGTTDGAGTDRVEAGESFDDLSELVKTLGIVAKVDPKDLGPLGAFITPSAAREAFHMAHRRKAMNEAAAIASLKAIIAAEGAFKDGDAKHAPAHAYATLEKLKEAELVDSVLGSGTKQGYIFRAGPGADAAGTFWAEAKPAIPHLTANRAFFANQSGSISYVRTERDKKAPDPDPRTGSLPEGSVPLGR